MINNRYLKPFLLIILLVSTLRGLCQADSAVINVASIRLDSSIGRTCWFASLPKGATIADSAIPYLPFKPGDRWPLLPALSAFSGTDGKRQLLSGLLCIMAATL